MRVAKLLIYCSSSFTCFIFFVGVFHYQAELTECLLGAMSRVLKMHTDPQALSVTPLSLPTFFLWIEMIKGHLSVGFPHKKHNHKIMNFPVYFLMVKRRYPGLYFLRRLFHKVMLAWFGSLIGEKTDEQTASFLKSLAYSLACNLKVNRGLTNYFEI